MTRKTGYKPHGAEDGSELVRGDFLITRRQKDLLTSLPPYNKSDVVRLALNEFFGDKNATLKQATKEAPSSAGQDANDGQES